VVFDCAGVQGSVDVAFEAVRVKGTVVNLAIWRKLPTVNANLFLSKQIRWIGSAVYTPGVFQEVIDAIVSGEWYIVSMKIMR
jgi:threonine dehydrogenase-like Zn-dependent dehydrogenase